MRVEHEEPQQVVEQCKGCSNITSSNTCRIYLYTKRQWDLLGGCAMRTHNKAKVSESHTFIDPLKASKRKAKGTTKSSKQ